MSKIVITLSGLVSFLSSLPFVEVLDGDDMDTETEGMSLPDLLEANPNLGPGDTVLCTRGTGTSTVTGQTYPLIPGRNGRRAVVQGPSGQRWKGTQSLFTVGSMGKTLPELLDANPNLGPGDQVRCVKADEDGDVAEGTVYDLVRGKRQRAVIINNDGRRFKGTQSRYIVA